MERHVAFLLLATLTACSSAPPEQSTEQLGLRESIITSGGDIPGFAHSAERSAFRFGAEVEDFLRDDGWRRRRGTEGAAALQPNGAWFAYANAGARSVSAGRFSGNAHAHERAVLDYLRRVGFPIDQIGSIGTGTTSYTYGTAGDPRSSVTTRVAYTTTVTRQIDGAPVPESVVAIQMTDTGETGMEFVYWPPVAAANRAEVQRLRDTIADVGGKYLATVAQRARRANEGTVAIHHPSAYVESAAATVRVVYDVPEAGPGGGPNGITRHFDRLGAEVRLPQELRYQEPTSR